MPPSPTLALPGFRFAHPFRVRYSEVDQQGVAYNAHYLTWFDVALWEYTKALGFDPLGHLRSGRDFHVVKATVEYHRPARLDDDLLVGVRAARMGRSSLVFATGVGLAATPGAPLLAGGEVVWVHSDLSTHRAIPLPPPLAAAIAAFDAPEANPGRPA